MQRLIGAIVLLGGLSAQSRDFEVVDQNGKKVQFYRDVVAGDVVAIDFIFTSCRTVCPTLGMTFARVERLLGAPQGVRLISISVDPLTDTPERLRDFAASSYEHTNWKPAAKSAWTLVTGERENVNELLRSLGGYTPDKLLHSTTVLIGREAPWAHVDGLGSADKIARMLLDGAHH